MPVTIGLRDLLYATTGCSAHDVRDTLIPSCARGRELSVRVEYALHSDRSNKNWGGVFDSEYRGLSSWINKMLIYHRTVIPQGSAWSHSQASVV